MSCTRLCVLFLRFLVVRFLFFLFLYITTTHCQNLLLVYFATVSAISEIYSISNSILATNYLWILSIVPNITRSRLQHRNTNHYFKMTQNFITRFFAWSLLYSIVSTYYGTISIIKSTGTNQQVPVLYDDTVGSPLFIWGKTPTN